MGQDGPYCRVIPKPDPFEAFLNKMGHGSQPSAEENAAKLRAVSAEVEVVSLELRLAKMVWRAQNNIDRAHNRALDKVLEDVTLNLTQIALVNARRKTVRHAKEFGDD